jgi:hypothetical protein
MISLVPLDNNYSGIVVDDHQELNYLEYENITFNTTFGIWTTNLSVLSSGNFAFVVKGLNTYPEIFEGYSESFTIQNEILFVNFTVSDDSLSVEQPFNLTAWVVGVDQKAFILQKTIEFSDDLGNFNESCSPLQGSCTLKSFINETGSFNISAKADNISSDPISLTVNKWILKPSKLKIVIFT